MSIIRMLFRILRSLVNPSAIQKWLESSPFTNFFIAIFLSLLFIRLAGVVTSDLVPVTLDQFKVELASGKIEKLQVDTNRHSMKYVWDDEVHVAPLVDRNNPDLAEAFSQNVGIQISQTDLAILVSGAIADSLVDALMLTIFIMIIRNGTGQSVRLVTQRPSVKFDDVIGCDDAKEAFRNVLSRFERRDELAKIGAPPAKGLVLSGPPGVGKTLLAKAAANECNMSFIEVSGSEFNEIFVGSGSRKVRKLFDTARKNAPCIIFIDEADSLFQQRGSLDGAIGKNSDQTVNQILAEMDGFKSNEGVLVILSTNAPDVLDRAATRSGRIEVNIHVDLPTLAGRRDLLAHYLGDYQREEHIDLQMFAKSCFGMSGADICRLVSEAKIHANQLEKPLSIIELKWARDNLLLGMHSSVYRREDLLRQVAVHEAGHAVAAHLFMPEVPIDMVSIQARGNAGGYTVLGLDADDLSLATKQRVDAQIKMLIAGRVAEDISFGDQAISTGASDDFEKATSLCFNYLYRYGFGKALVVLKSTAQYDASQSIIHEADIRNEINAMLTDQVAQVRKAFNDNRYLLDSVARALLKAEILHHNELKELFDAHALSHAAIV